MNGDICVLAILPGNVEQRQPCPREIEFFRNHPHITGMAADDGRVILSPFSELTDHQKRAVSLNEAARIFMVREGLTPQFDLTPAQKAKFISYGPIDAQRATVAARLLSGDPSAMTPTDKQIAFVRDLAAAMGVEIDSLVG